MSEKAIATTVAVLAHSVHAQKYQVLLTYFDVES